MITGKNKGERMGTAQIQGSLWGARARDYANLVEGMFRPIYAAVFAQTGVGPGTRLLDVGCGPGLAAQIAAQCGAQVSGLDAAEASLVIARERTPEGDFHAGEMEELPWPEKTFDVVTSFNAFQFAADIDNALGEAKRVVKPGGRVAMVVWGRDEEIEIMATMAAVAKLLPPPPKVEGAPPPLSSPGRVEALLEQAGLAPLTSGVMDCPLEFPDLDTAVCGFMSVGPLVAAVERVDAVVVRQVVADSLGPFRTSDGGYRQRNKLRYVIASA
jgi:SAM-dependent methyltransferase